MVSCGVKHAINTVSKWHEFEYYFKLICISIVFWSHNFWFLVELSNHDQQQTCQPLRILRNHYAFRVSNTPLRKPVQNVGKLRILRNFSAIRPIPRNLQHISRLAVSRKSPAGQNIDNGLVYFTITIGFGIRFRHPINKGSCRGETMANEIGFRSRFSQCVDYMRFNEKSFCFRWQETTKLMLFGNTKTSSLVILCDLRYLTGNISSVMTKHMAVQRKLHRFAYLIVQIISSFYS